MNRTTLTAFAATAALTAGSALAAGSAHAEAIVYENYNVRAKAPDETLAGAEHASIKIPTGYTKHKPSWHRWAWVENVENGITIGLDLQPRRDTVKELKAERAALKEAAGEDYKEFAFRVNDLGSKVRARWVYSYSEPNSGNVDPYTSVILLRGGNRLLVAGEVAEMDLAKRIRRHTVRTISFPG
jgi:hypothetical protein